MANRRSSLPQNAVRPPCELHSTNGASPRCANGWSGRTPDQTGGGSRTRRARSARGRSPRVLHRQSRTRPHLHRARRRSPALRRRPRSNAPSRNSASCPRQNVPQQPVSAAAGVPAPRLRQQRILALHIPFYGDETARPHIGLNAKSSTGSLNPLRAYRPTERVVRPSSRPAKRSDISSLLPLSAHAVCIRLTRLTSGPISVKSSQEPDPMLP